ncbi:Oidioi.mRNA.OKI2018_I69.PAR.g12645.t1.cds [Oikopleura dioica]|uniref:Oidioi.mRNA.OKI2018_I69.PAR.g12645.t1.cds n=1 Tax=Oikopleura dioica TaxID=34765 RepID=A0ABN7S0V4_OIKDI|nr:Oidioi.mRNA.OKI2018_I69.PAR.g12645.t1.cds [Oikopleura dioica]
MNLKIFLISTITAISQKACKEGICIACYEKVFINLEKSPIAEKCGMLLRKQCCIQYLIVSNGMGLPAHGKTNCKNLPEENGPLMNIFSTEEEKKPSQEEIELGLENLDEIAGDYSDTYQEDLERCAAERIAQRESQVINMMIYVLPLTVTIMTISFITYRYRKGNMPTLGSIRKYPKSPVLTASQSAVFTAVAATDVSK